MNSKYKSVITLISCIVFFSLSHVGFAQQSKDDTIFFAIKEEVQRALKGLKMDGLQSPFFISYSIGDFESISVSATLGSTTSLEHYQSRSSDLRLLMGDYKCTDENFSGDVSGEGNYDGSPCIENNIKGLRYTIWRDLDAVYKSAAEIYEQKLSAIKQLNIPKEELDLPDWDKVPVVVMKNLPEKQINFNSSQYEEYAKQASLVYKGYKDVYDSEVSLRIFKANIYFYNTEGTEFKYPLSFVVLSSSAMSLTENGEMVYTNLNGAYSTPAELPKIENFKEECRQLAERLLIKRKAPVLTESYSGPVLFEDRVVAEFFYLSFFDESPSLIARRKPISSGGYSYGGNRLEEMMNKRITAKEITITDLTGTPEYNGKPLLGYVPIDAQGVVPPKELVLVDKGILKTLLNDRTPTHKVPHSNGHRLFSIGGIYSRVSTGVVKFDDSRKKDDQTLRRELFEKATEEGYDHTFIVRGTMSNLEIYKVNIATGKEELVRSAKINEINQQSFKKILGVSDKETILESYASNLISIIVPKAILFEDLEIQKSMFDNYQKPPIVPQPTDF